MLGTHREEVGEEASCGVRREPHSDGAFCRRRYEETFSQKLSEDVSTHARGRASGGSLASGHLSTKQHFLEDMCGLHPQGGILIG